MDASEEQRQALEAFVEYLQNSTHGDLDGVKSKFSHLGEAVYDVVWLAGLHSDSADFRQAYNSAVSSLCASGTLKQPLCLEQLDDEVLSACHFIDNKDAFEKKIRRVRTKVLYEQQKFNLLREESNGYGKLLCVLADQSQGLRERMQLVIGAYDLDPNRVLDMLLDCLETQPHRHEVLDLVQEFSPMIATQLLGFKFLSAKVYRPGFALVAGWLIKRRVTSLRDLWSYLQPQDDQETITSYTQRLAQALELRRVITAEKEEEDIAELRRQTNDNQKFWAMEGLIRVNCWTEARNYLQSFQKKMEITRHPHLVDALCQLLSWGIEPFYRTLSPSSLFTAGSPHVPAIPEGDLQQAGDLHSCLALIAEVLEVLDICIVQDPVLYAKVCRVLCLCPSDPRAQALVQSYLLPALSLSRGNLGVASALWSVFSKFPVSTRYEMYEHWHSTDSIPLVILEQSLTIRSLQALLKRLSKESAPRERKSLLKLMHTCPVAAFHDMLVQVMNYENLIPVFIKAMSYCTPLLLDIVPHVLIKLLTTGNRPKLDLKMGTVAPWFQNLAMFAGHFFRSQHGVCLTGLLSVIGAEVRKGDILQFTVLQQVLAKMSGWEEPNQLTESQLRCSTAGMRLRIESLEQTQEFRGAKKSGEDLILSLKKPVDSPLKTIVTDLLVLSATQARAVLQRLDISHVKLLGMFYDQLQSEFVELSEFLQFHTTNAEDFSVFLPEKPIKTLLAIEGLRVEQVMHVCRPAYRLEHIQEVMEQLEGRNQNVPLEFFTLFWLLSVQDIENSSACYESTMENLSKEMTEANPAKPAKTKKEIHRLSVCKEEIDQENKSLQTRRESADEFLRKHVESLAGCSGLAADIVQVTTMQLCIFPRILLTSADAMYCARFLEKAQQLRFPGFETRDIVHQVSSTQLITGLVPCVYCSTEREAENLGFFFSSLFKILESWENEERFNSECLGTPGFEGCDSAQFKGLLSSCYNRVSIILGKCFDSGDYMKQRNSLMVLWKLTPEFPTTCSMADQLLVYTSKVKDSGLSDLKVLAQRYNDKILELKRERWPEKVPAPPSPTTKLSPTPPDQRPKKRSRLRSPPKPSKPRHPSRPNNHTEDKEVIREKKKETEPAIREKRTHTHREDSDLRHPQQPSERHHNEHRDRSVRKHSRHS